MADGVKKQQQQWVEIEITWLEENIGEQNRLNVLLILNTVILHNTLSILEIGE